MPLLKFPYFMKDGIMPTARFGQRLGAASSLLAPALVGALSSRFLTDNLTDGALIGMATGAVVGSLSMAANFKNLPAAQLGFLFGAVGGALGGATAQ